MKTRKLLLSVIGIVFSQGATAQVDLQTGEWALSRKDQIKYSAKDSVKIERTYSSRSTHQGLFGLGWCSELEWRFYAADRLLQKCDSFMEIEKASLQRKNGESRIQLSPHRTLIFAADTRLAALEVRGRSYSLMRDLTGRATGLQNSKGLLASFSRSQVLQCLTKITVAGAGVLSFSYDKGQLHKAGGESYDYDSDSNLIRVHNKKEDIARIEYDPQDRATKVSEGACQTRYIYLTVDSKSQVRDRVIVERACSGLSRHLALADYVYKKLSSGELELTSSLTKE